MAVRPTEISDIIRSQIAGFDDATSLTNVGTVVSIGDGIANVYGLSNVMASELVEFPRTNTTRPGLQPGRGLRRRPRPR